MARLCSSYLQRVLEGKVPSSLQPLQTALRRDPMKEKQQRQHRGEKKKKKKGNQKAIRKEASLLMIRIWVALLCLTAAHLALRTQAHVGCCNIGAAVLRIMIAVLGSHGVGLRSSRSLGISMLGLGVSEKILVLNGHFRFL